MKRLLYYLYTLLIIGVIPIGMQAQDLSGSTWKSTFDHKGAKGHITYHFTTPGTGYYEYSVKSIFRDYKGQGSFTYITEDGQHYTFSDTEHPDDPEYETRGQIRGQLLTLSMPPRMEQMVEDAPDTVRKILDEYLSDMLTLKRRE